MRTCKIALFAFALLLPSVTAFAAGYGAYFEYARGRELEYEWNDVKLPKIDEDSIGFGFAFDTAVAKDKLFNYRLNVGYQWIRHDYPSEFGILQDHEIEMNGLTIDNTFGFGIVRNRVMRLWLGPALRLGFLFYDVADVDFFEFRLGIGPQLGVNFHLGDRVSLGITGGYQYVILAGTNDELIDTNDTYDDAFTGSEHLIGVKATVFFRSAGDIFGERP